VKNTAYFDIAAPLHQRTLGSYVARAESSWWTPKRAPTR
jgi:hypothetical protein